MTKKKLVSALLVVVMLISLVVPVSADFVAPEDNNISSHEMILEGDLAYFVSDESDQHEVINRAFSFEAGAIDANGTMRSQLSTAGKNFFDKLNSISISQVKAASRSSDGFMQMRFPISGISGTKLSGSVSGGKLYLDSASTAKYNAIVDELDVATVAFRYDRPDVIWMCKVELGFYYRATGTQIEIGDVMIGFMLYYNGKEESMWREMTANASLIANTIKDKNMDRYNQVRYAHELLADINEYSSIISDYPYHPSHLAYSALVPSSGEDPVCDGYSKAFKMVMDRLGIPCVTPSSYSGNHMWNNIKMEDGKWYNLDLTWADTGGDYDYFLIGSDALKDEYHREENPVVTETPKDATTLVYPTKNVANYAYAGTILDYDDLPDLSAELVAKQIFPDVYRNQWYYDYVGKAVDYKVFNGDDKGNFNPTRSLTRAQFAQALANYMNFDETKYTSNPFIDLANNNWASPAVAWANEMRYMEGSGGRFRPSDPITREELCVVFERLDKLPAIEMTDELFNDDSTISPWARSAVYYCKMSGIIDGDTAGNFNPRNNTTRAQAAKVFVEYIEKNEANKAA